MSILELPVDLWCSNTKNSENGKLPSISQFLDTVSKIVSVMLIVILII